jgi:hypothetical protein
MTSLHIAPNEPIESDWIAESSMDWDLLVASDLEPGVGALLVGVG